MLKEYSCVFTPDFSLYADYPLAMQIYNHYRKQWLGAFLQENGVNIIPTVCWSDDLSYEFCFDGVPTNSIVACSNTGAVKGFYQSELFRQGFIEMHKRLNPSLVLMYGKETDFLKEYCEVTKMQIKYVGNCDSRFLAN